MRRVSWNAMAIAALLLAGGCLGKIHLRRVRSFAAIDYGLPEKYITLGGVKLCYVDMGKGAETLLFLPPAMSSIKVWRHQIRALARRYRVLALDLPGHGKSDKPPHFRYRPPAFADVVARFLSKLGVRAATLIGNSNGGATALAFALRRPERVQRLVLVSPAGVRAASPLRQRFLRWVVTKGNIGTLVPWATKLGLERFAFGKTGPFSDTYISDQLALRGAGAEFQAWLKAQVRTIRAAVSYDVSKGLKGIAVPTLVVWGDKDRLLPVALGKLLRKGIPGSELVVLPGVGHMPELEVPEALTRIIETFLKRTAAKVRTRATPATSGTDEGASPRKPSKAKPAAATKDAGNDDAGKDDDKDDDKDKDEEKE